MSDRIKFIFEAEYLLDGGHGPFTIITKDNSKIVVYDLKLEDKYMSINSNNDGSSVGIAVHLGRVRTG